MDERLLVKATPALLEGWCGPVVYEGEETVWWFDSRLTAVGTDLCWSDRWEGVALDLARAESRDRVCRVLADSVTTADGFDSGSCHGVQWIGAGSSWVLYGDGDLRFASGGGTDAVNVPALADLDATDDTRLPDGSRLVDALALAAVAREVLE